MKLPVPPGSMLPVSKAVKLVPVAVWGTLSLFVHTTVLLTPMTRVTTSGEKAVDVRLDAPATIDICVVWADLAPVLFPGKPNTNKADRKADKATTLNWPDADFMDRAPSWLENLI